MEDRVETVVKHASGLLGLGELVAQGLVLFKDWSKNDNVHAILENLRQDAPPIEMRVLVLNCLLSFKIDLCEVFDVLNGLFQVSDFVNVDGEQSI